VKDILHRRRATPALHAAHPVPIVDTGLAGVFGFVRRSPTGALLGLFNMTEHWQNLPEAVARAQGVSLMYDALSDAPVTPHYGQIALPPFARVWLT
jgi:amylosucrase